MTRLRRAAAPFRSFGLSGIPWRPTWRCCARVRCDCRKRKVVAHTHIRWMSIMTRNNDIRPANSALLHHWICFPNGRAFQLSCPNWWWCPRWPTVQHSPGTLPLWRKPQDQRKPLSYEPSITERLMQLTRLHDICFVLTEFIESSSDGCMAWCIMIIMHGSVIVGCVMWKFETLQVCGPPGLMSKQP